ncbi:hypothetical protein [Winogradskyella rapida]|uniref:Septum formation initiator n=1 Tax=Winogradskyella rapida TaxID=549701 RepID=A0ABW3KLB8_9FLAO
MKKTLLIIILVTVSNLFAQQTDSKLGETVNNLQIQVNQQQADIQKLYSELNKEYRTYRIVKKNLNQKIIDKKEELVDSLNTLIDKSKAELASINEQLKTKIKETDKIVVSNNSKISDLGNSLDKNRLYWIIGTLATLLLGGLVYWLLGKRIQSSKIDVETQIKNTKASLEEESVKLDTKLVEVLTKQLDVFKVDQAITSQANDNDHSLVLKVADRLTAMETNHYRMDPKTKGLKQLVRAVKSIKENYLASGYEIVEMIGQEYKDGLNVTANFIPSEEIETGKRVITRIIKPQVNFNGKMIQAAQIEVSVGE